MSENSDIQSKKMTRMSTRLATKASNNLLWSERRSSPKKTRRPRRVRTEYFACNSDSDCEDTLSASNLKLDRTPTKQKSKTSIKNLNSISPVTPPKQRRQTNDANENIPQTPSSLLKKLCLTSPNSKTSNKDSEWSHIRDKVFNEEHKKLDFETQEDGVFQNAKKALFGSFPSKMPGRQKEHEELKHFISENIKNKSAASLYISGPPGTGKTASLNVILQENNFSSEFHKVYINCTAIKSTSSVYSKLNKELKIKDGRTEKENLNGIDNFLKKSGKMVLLVLDEIDQLESKNQSILYTIFEWPSKPKSRLILIGIANALDLTDRVLPRLQARCELKPKLMHFSPYNKQQIVEIFTSRLEEAGVLDVFSPVALQLLAGKVASVSGDVRRALDIGRRVIELVEQNKKHGILKSIENLADTIIEKEEKKIEVSKNVQLKQVIDVLNNVYGTAQNLGVQDEEDSMPLQQKIIICSLLLLLKKTKSKDITVGKLHGVYSRICAKRNLLAVDQAEFVGLCSLIQTKGIIRVSGKKEVRLHKINLEWNENEVADALKDKQLMSSILQDEMCLGNL